MKIRESGMPEAEVWDAFFDPEQIMRAVGPAAGCKDVVEFGCGYGTFTIEAARRIEGTVHALDIDASMIATAEKRVQECAVRNIVFTLRDFVAAGSGLPSGSMDFVMLFNILHHEEPLALLREAFRNLKTGGHLGIVHWNCDPATPRGPPMSIRPSPEQCAEWAEAAGFTHASGVIDLPPYHYGLRLRRDSV